VGTTSPTAEPTSTSTPMPTCDLAWRVVYSSDDPNSTDSDLVGVSAISPDDVWAVGRYVIADIARTLIMHWDGSEWLQIDSPNRGPSPTNNYLGDVSGVATDDVWAVGANDTNGGGQYKTLTEHWDGEQWTIVPSADIITTTNVLRSVSTLSPNDVWAAGYFLETQGENGYERTLVEHWDGSQWSIVPSPNSGREARFWDVAALSHNDVWAVGSYTDVNVHGHSLVEHWDGIQWSIVPSPSPGQDVNSLYGVSALAPNDVWAVGRRRLNPTTDITFTIHWDGSQWSEVPSPNIGTTLSELDDVVVISSEDVWAVGYSCCGAGGTITMHWDGVQWTNVPHPNPGNTNNFLKGVDALSTGNVWAVGYMQHCGSTGCPWLTVTEHYSTQCQLPSPTPTVTGTRTILPTDTRTPSSPTSTRTPSFTPTPSTTRSATPTVTQTPTITPCPMTFTDVQPTDYFYEAVHNLYCAGVISGYEDNTFRPYNDTTRGQLCKIVVLAEGWQIECPAEPHFSDVAPDNPFYCYIETAYFHNIISGYGDGTFRPGNNVTRGQLCKIVVLAEGWSDDCPPTGHFTDVPPTDPFYCFVETAYSHGIISGYADGTFRPGNPATRGQICKIVYQALTGPHRE